MIAYKPCTSCDKYLHGKLLSTGSKLDNQEADIQVRITTGFADPNAVSENLL
ncbi:MAG: hypothetical protein JRC67_11195 [Deltaproteobacteria bacterium]|jgi:hypothetical protein|nr:hypothetical protein [Deltaproteobacteria bacterium]